MKLSRWTHSTAHRYLLLLAVLLLGTIHEVSSMSLSEKFHAKHNPSTRKPPSKKPLPTVELVRRRKSPALWREDLLLQDTSTTSSSQLVKSEVMAPAGGWPQLKAAVGNGADAVFLGLSAFSARARATNFDVYEDLPQAVQFCHEAGVKVYVALNTLVFDHELEEVSKLIQAAEQAGVDALIVQDLGVCQVAKKVAPKLALHSSTQQSVTSADGVEFCQDQHGAERVVLGRELSVEEMRQVSSSTQVELEAFVHGALCVSYSGQCFSSEAWGGRSANRGQCAQACRMPYGLIANGDLVDLQDMTYLLSPQDLCGLDQVPALMEAGVTCLKIEGRLKDQAYVAATTRAYRNAVDQAWKEKTGQDPTRILPAQEFVTRQELTQLFSRGQDESHGGLTPGFLDGTKHQRLVRGRSPRHRGVHVGRVAKGSSPKNGLIVEGDKIDLKLGDGIVIDRGMAQAAELGGPIFDLARLSDQKVQLQFGRDVTRKWKQNDDSARHGVGNPFAPAGAHVWKTHDATVDKKMRRLSESMPPKPAVKVMVSGTIGSPLSVTLTDGTKTAVGLTIDPLQPATKAGLDPKKLKKAIGTLGDTKWAIEREANVDGVDPDAWCPMSQVKEARRQAVAEWQALHDGGTSETKEPSEKLIHGAPARLLEEALGEAETDRIHQPNPKLSVLARNMDQVNAICEMVEEGEQIDEIVVDFLEVEGMKEAVARIRMAGVASIVASPRIIKPDESGIWRTLLRLEPDGLLVRSTGLLYRLKQLGGTGAEVDVGSEKEHHMVKIPTLYGDFSLNAANALTALEILHSGLERITASYDINAKAITQMATLMGDKARHLEITVHCKMPIFHTEHCVFARFLSKGDSYLDCGHVCTRNNIHLRDSTGADNLVLADMGCRNTVFSAEAQSGCHSVKEWRQANVGALRVELVDEGKLGSKTIVRQYLGLLDGTKKPSEVWEALQYIKDSNGRAGGVSLGSFNNKIQRRAGELSEDV